jgi:hypothetical protein
VKWLLFILLVMPIYAEDSCVLLNGFAAKNRKGCEVAFIKASNRDIYNFPLSISLNTVEYSDPTGHETRLSVGTGVVDGPTIWLIEVVGAHGFLGNRIGMRGQAIWRFMPYVHAGAYMTGFSKGGYQGEFGISLGIHFPHSK